MVQNEKLYETTITTDTLAKWYCEEYGIEIWKDIPGWDGLYQASILGRIRSLKYYGGARTHLKSTKLNNKGYLLVELHRNGKSFTRTVHRLVAETFIPNPDNLPEVNHKDEDKTNCSIWNLEWCNRDYNQKYGTSIERIHQKTRRPIIQLTTSGELVKEWSSAMEIKKVLGYDNTLIGRVCAGKKNNHTAYGYVWKNKTGD